MKDLTPAQRAALNFVTDRLMRGRSPSIREICAAMGYRSTRAVHDVLAALIGKGYLTKASGRARSLGLPHNPESSPTTNPSRPPSGRIPLLGSIVAGPPEENAESREDGLPFEPGYFGIPPHHRAFALRVRGDSMTGRHLLAGDIVVCDADTEAHHGDIVAALIDHESTLKTLIHRDGTSWLRAENPAYPEFHPVAELTIQGVVFGVIRSRAA